MPKIAPENVIISPNATNTELSIMPVGITIKPAINNYILPMFKTLSSGGSLSDIGPLMLSFGKLLIGVLILFLIGVFASWSNQRLMLYISTKTLFTIRTDLFNRLEKLPIKFYDSHTHGELMSRFTNDTDTLREMMSQTIPQLLSSTITVFGILIMMIVLSPLLTILVLFITFLIFQLIKVIGKKSANAFRANQQAIGKLNGFIEEMIEGQKIIKVFNHEEIGRASCRERV